MGSSPALALAPTVWRIPVAPSDGINAFVLQGDDSQITLIDAGMPWAWKRLEQGLAHIGIQVADVTNIVVTHAHGDHVGNVERARQESQAPVSAHELDAPFLADGQCPPIDPSRHFRSLLMKWGRFDKITVSDTFNDGQLLDLAGGLRVMHTPGHTPGHTSFVHEPTGVLITGDVIHYWRSAIRIGIKLYCHDIALNEESAHKLSQAECETVAFTHGPHLEHDGRRRLHEFLAQRR